MTEKNLTEKKYFWDNLRTFLIFVIVISEFAARYPSESKVFQLIILFTTAFMFPLLLFAEGLSAKHKLKEGLNTSRIFHLIGMYLGYKVLFFLIQVVCGQEASFQLFTETRGAWYFLALAQYYLVTYLVKDVKPWIVLLCAVILACASGYDDKIGDTLVLSRAFVHWPFFLVGYYADRKVFEKFTAKTWVKIAGVAILLATAAVFILKLNIIIEFKGFLQGKTRFSNLKYYSEFGGLLRLIYYPFAAVLGISAAALVPRKKIPYLSGIGPRYMQVYFWHQVLLFFMVWSGIVDKMMGVFPGMLWKLIYLAIGAVMPLIFSAKILGNPLKF